MGALLVQTAIPGAPMGIMEIVVGLALMILIALSGYQLRTSTATSKEMTAIKQLLLGFDGRGENGSLLGQIKTLRSQMQGVSERHRDEDTLRARGIIVTPDYMGTERRVEARREDDPPPPGAAT